MICCRTATAVSREDWHMELRSVEELMDLLYACRGTPGCGSAPVDLQDHALRTAALLRRSRPADKELQVAGLVRSIGPLLWPGEPAVCADRAADAVRALLGERVALLVRRQPLHDTPADDDLLTLRQADEEGRTAAFDAGLEGRAATGAGRGRIGAVRVHDRLRHHHLPGA
jgi:hypothetical protein